MKPHLYLISFLLLILTVSLTGCGRGQGRAISGPQMPQAHQVSNLSLAADPALRAFADAVVPKFAASDKHVQVTVAEGPSPDVRLVLAAAEGDSQPFAHMPLGLVVPKGNPAEIASLQDLASARVKKIAVPPDTSPVAAAARQAFRKAGLEQAVTPKLLVASTQSVHELVAQKQAQVGVEALTSARAPARDAEEHTLPCDFLGSIPDGLAPPVECRAQVGANASDPAAAQALAAWLQSADGQRLAQEEKLQPVMPPSEQQGEPLFVYCGTGIRPPLQEATAEFTRNTGIPVEATFAGSGCLLSQLNFARRGDLYLPGEVFYIDQARKRGFISDEHAAAAFIPVILVLKGNPKRIRTLADLAKPGMRLGLGEPKATAIGRETVRILDKVGLREAVFKNCVLSGANVAEIGNALKLKTLDAIIVWNANAFLYRDSCDTVELPADLAQPVDIYVGLLSFTRQEANARKLMNFLCSERGEEIFRQNGYAPPHQKGPQHAARES